MEVNVSQYPQLREEQRITARQQARANLLAKLGGEPQYQDFEKHHWSRFGVGWERATLLFLIIVFLSALWVSSGHIYRVFDDSFAMVILAESTILALSLVPTVWNTPRPVTVSMYVGVLGAAFIAAVGNIDAEIIYTSSPLNWLGRWWGTLATAPKQWTAATVPPMITVLVGQGLKYYALSRSEDRREAKTHYDQAMIEWRETVRTLEQHPDWLNTYAWALWDTWRKGKRQELISGISKDERSAIVLREVEADQILPEKVSEIAENSVRRVKTSSENNNHAVRRVIEYLDEDPARFQLSGAEISEILQVSEPSVSRGKKKFSENGYHHE